MKRLIGVLVVSAAVLMMSCVQSGRIEGVVRDIAENTITIIAEDDTLVTFSTRGAKFLCDAGIHCGSPVTITFRGDITDGFGNAERVEAPEDYNLLVGRWVASYEDAPEFVHGFELLPDGDVIEIGDHSIIYNCWRYADGVLSLAEEEENLDEEIFDLVNHWQVEHLDRSTLTVSGYGQTWIFARSQR